MAKQIKTWAFFLFVVSFLVGCGGRETAMQNSTGNDKTEVMPSTEMEESEIQITENIAETEEVKEEEKIVLTKGSPSISPEEATDVSIEISKTNHTLTLYNGVDVIATYPVGLAKNAMEAKEKEGDHKNPEGEYYVCNKNTKSQYHLALGLSYPGIPDALRGYEDGLITEEQRDSIIAAIESGGKPDWYTPLGGEIMIHGQKGEQGSGSDWTRGCFATENEIMDAIWDYIPVGTKVTIKR